MHQKVPEGWIGWIRKELEGYGSRQKVLEGFGRSLDPHLVCGKAPAQPHVISIKAGPLWPGEGQVSLLLRTASAVQASLEFPGIGVLFS